MIKVSAICCRFVSKTERCWCASRRPRRPEGFALIRLLCGGICNTDLELQRGYYGFRGTPGHEFVGEVVEADDRSWIGQRVVGEINLACGKCEWCARGLGRHCPNRTVLGIVKQPGAFREFLTLPERNLAPRAARDSVRGSGVHRAAGRGVRDSGSGAHPARRAGGGAGRRKAGAAGRARCCRRTAPRCINMAATRRSCGSPSKRA